jgi:integrase
MRRMRSWPHLSGRGFSAATVRAYAFDVLNLARFLTERKLALAVVDATVVFDWIDWQGVRRPSRAGAADRVRADSAAASTVNRRVAAVRALFEYLVMSGRRIDKPVPSPRRGQGLRRSQRGLLGHLGLGRAHAGGRLVRQPRLLPESLPASDIDAFVATLGTHRAGRWCWRCCSAGCGQRRCAAAAGAARAVHNRRDVVALIRNPSPIQPGSSPAASGTPVPSGS